MLRADIGTGREATPGDAEDPPAPDRKELSRFLADGRRPGHSLRTIRTMENNAYRHSHTAEL